MFMQIVSLIAGVAEIICASGFEDCLVSRFYECDYSKNLTGIPACSSPETDVNVSVIEIDKNVKMLFRNPHLFIE